VTIFILIYSNAAHHQMLLRLVGFTRLLPCYVCMGLLVAAAPVGLIAGARIVVALRPPDFIIVDAIIGFCPPVTLLLICLGLTTAVVVTSVVCGLYYKNRCLDTFLSPE
jgi:hypothetical protein